CIDAPRHSLRETSMIALGLALLLQQPAPPSPGVGGRDATGSVSGGIATAATRELLGHPDVATTMIYTHVLNQGGLGVRSPTDVLAPRARGPQL
ncbi:MAG TPA: hypothetical protein VNL98_02620, partial [Gemmatimonadales bacterium]|nr:hypothetical protein [Gemmatimonadales bacterium]